RRRHKDRREHGRLGTRRRADLSNAAPGLQRVPEVRSAARRRRPARRQGEGQHPTPGLPRNAASDLRGGARRRCDRAGARRMTDLPTLTLPPLPATLPAPRGESALLPGEAEPALLDLLFAASATPARVPAAPGAPGALVLETPKGQIAIPNGPDLPVGAEVEVRLAGRTPPLAALRLVAAPPSAAAGGMMPAHPVTQPAAEIVRGAPLSAVLLAAPPEE